METARRPLPSALRAFLNNEASGGILLMAAAAAAMLVANSPLGDAYFHLMHAETGPVLTPKLGPMTVHLWINDALMAVFFLLVGLEIKREFVDGHLSSWSDRILPVVAAVGGMIVPAAVYLLIAGDDAALVRGWAIPAATDIAFAIGVLGLLGTRAPTSLKLLLTTLAIVDDMGAVMIIALFYTAGLSTGPLLAAVAIWVLMLLIGRAKVSHLWPYIVLAVGLWLAVLLSGVHATLAGVLAALAIPIRNSPGRPDDEKSPLHRLEHGLSPWVAFLIVPLFGFANAGVSLAGVSLGHLLAPLPLGVAAGLFLGKQIGVFVSVRLAVAAGWAVRPFAATWLQLYGTALLCGIGFTMSLFIGGLAFPEAERVDAVKIGVLLGSLLSAIGGYAVLRLAPAFPRRTSTAPENTA